jgi:hypothetical protein
MDDFADNSDLGKVLADAIDDLEAKRPFAGDLEVVFVVPLDDGTEYEVTVSRKVND